MVSNRLGADLDLQILIYCCRTPFKTLKCCIRAGSCGLHYPFLLNSEGISMHVYPPTIILTQSALVGIEAINLKLVAGKLRLHYWWFAFMASVYLSDQIKVLVINVVF